MIRYSFIYSLLALLLFSCGRNQSVVEIDSKEIKIITAGGTVSEIVAALGFQDQIIATDITSTYPADLQKLPSIGYRNQIKTEGILALGPDLVLAEEGYLTPDVVQQLESTGIVLHFFKKPKQISETYGLINDLGAFLKAEEKALEIVARLEADEAALKAFVEENQKKEKPKVAFVMARGLETIFLAGEETFAESLIEMAGGEFAGKGFKDFIPLTPEAIVSINPDYLLFFESGLATIGGNNGVSQIRGLDQTTAFQKQQVLASDGHYLSGFGPRIAEAALELARSISKN
ncbi:heme/hemin ABC transporter substrate-binding protein [Cecembia calidifontis]|uniref:Iron complex transport system substrate-binding protein n=1 Tax=Cecembia calidifontis TaxID=1187080 RepID=A0A4Q7P4J4_9BACT|nr:ABC transporter substrate-binding protein [Cecembia calidifontis]RZS94913.1 iron complex transport system substrate-binding protein [Cecembia calidifontis]